GGAAKTAASASGSTAIAGAVGGSGIATAGGVLAGIIAFVLVALLVGQIVSALFGFWDAEDKKRSMEGLPPYITYEMVEEAIRCQEEFGHPAGCTIAQIICESGQGETMSQLATRDHNLFGMKWASSFASAPEVAGKAGWTTHEEYTPGQISTITAYFTVFKGDVECIRFRSRVFLQAAHYRNNALIRQAVAEHSSDKMAEGLKDAGWATSSSYVESLKAALDAYNLRRFDSMTVEDLEGGALSADAIVAAAYSQLGVPYVWGGTTPGVGLDCSGLTQYCYRQAGIAIPRNSEDQAAFGRKVPVSEATPGDILWRPGHVGIYIGDDRYIHEPHTGAACTIASGASYFTSAIKIR
ncbi:NlpC/P60 family protein, partial [Eggerthella sinensis]